jgi:glycosyltransferase involved in cell wall biosynthesis
MSRLGKGAAAQKNLNELVAAADAFRDQRAWIDAAESYRAALEIDPALFHIWVQYGHALKGSGRLKEAEEAYGRALAGKDEADTHLQLGHLHKVMGRAREAEDDYLRALERQPACDDARAELTHMGWSGKRLRARLAAAGAIDPRADAGQAFIAFELSDLIDHLQRNPFPTGIQRVQLELGAALAGNATDAQVQFVYYDHLQSDFFEVTFRQVLDIVHLVDTVERGAEVLRQTVDRIKTDIATTEPFEFPNDAYLVNVGTSWGFLNYFLSIRDLRQRVGLRYVPFVHDCIPLIYPEFCNPNLVCDFINWITLMIGHADLILANSENTKADLHKVAEELNEPLPAARTVHLNGEYGGRITLEAGRDRTTTDALRPHNLDVEDFVLFVSTIEPRKNHMLALNAWSRMLKSRPAAKVPRLVCVGNSGWMNDAFTQRLAHDSALRERVVVMRNVSDQTLRLLYQKCLFTLFPSLYEGWGLPISEALAHGKIPLVSHVSSHPEAGGELAVYFDPGSEADFQTKLESLIDNAGMRHAREAKIAAAKPLRAWSKIAEDILAIAGQHLAELPHHPRVPGKSKAPPPIACGRYYSFARNRAPKLALLAHSGDIYRAGLNWHGPEPWGCWIRGASADVAFSLAQQDGNSFLVYLNWTGSSNIDNAAILSLPPSTWSKRIDVPRGEAGWAVVPIAFKPDSKRDVRLRITAEVLDDFTQASEGHDTRVSSIGLKGIYICRASDALQRMAIIEAIELGDFDSVARRSPEAAVL